MNSFDLEVQHNLNDWKNMRSNMTVRKKTRAKYFTGYITDVQIWNYPLNQADSLTWSSCKSTMGGNVFNWLDYSSLMSSEVSYAQLCPATQQKIIIISEKLSHDKMSSYCNGIGGWMYRSGSAFDPERENILSKFQKYPKCHDESYTWTQFTRNNNNILVNEFGEEIDSESWELFEPNGGFNEDCGVLSLDTNQYSDKACSLQLCGICLLNAHTTYNVRGDTSPFLFDSMFYLSDTYRNEKLILEGLAFSTLYFENLSWVISYQEGFPPYWILEKSYSPFGKHVWKLNENFSVHISIDSCNNKEYNCDDGSCVDIEKRCNGKFDCADSSDEARCTTIFHPTSYDKSIPPTEEDGTPLILDLKELSLGINNIEDTKSLINMQFTLITKWRDSRLTFLNIKPKTNFSISSKEFESIWSPKFALRKTTEENLIENPSFRNIIVTTNDNGMSSGIRTVDHAKTFQGSVVDIILRQLYNVKIICKFDELPFYPFDENECKFDLFLSSSEQGWDFKDSNMKFEKSFHLNPTPYDVPPYEVKENEATIKETGILTVSLSLKRKFTGVFFQQILPIYLLTWIVYTSCFYYTQMFEAAISVNVTCLLTISGMVNSQYQYLPVTTSLKVIDILNIKSIVLTSLVILMQTLLVKYRSGSCNLRALEMILVWVIPIIGLAVDSFFLVYGVLYEMDLV